MIFFCFRVSQVILQVESRTQDLLEAGKVALEAIGEDSAAADMQGAGAAVAEGIKLEVGLCFLLHLLLLLLIYTPECVCNVGPVYFLDLVNF